MRSMTHLVVKMYIIDDIFISDVIYWIEQSLIIKNSVMHYSVDDYDPCHMPKTVAY